MLCCELSYYGKTQENATDSVEILNHAWESINLVTVCWHWLNERVVQNLYELFKGDGLIWLKIKKVSLCWLQLNIITPPILFVHLDCWTNEVSNKKSRRRLWLIWNAVIWVIWKERNDRIFNNCVKERRWMKLWIVLRFYLGSGVWAGWGWRHRCIMSCVGTRENA